MIIVGDVRTVGELEQKDCSGCSVCGDLCPSKAISFHDDSLNGFYYPKVDGNKCIHCGLCINRCTQNNPVRRKNVMPEAKVFAAWSNNDEIRLLCTSGGIFYELAHKVIHEGGVVIACSYTDDFRGAYHKAAFNDEELISLCGSKHVQSRTEGIYLQAKTYLESYPLVMFAGAPCQIAGLYAFLQNECEPENLITVDFICNSINSPKAQAKYIDYLEEIYGSKLIYARSKDKRYGWNKFGSSAKFENGREYYASRNEDARVLGYHHGHLFIRTSCLDCKYKVLPRNADITLADFWGIEPDERNPKLELGTSAVMCNSEKGRAFFESLGESVGCYEKTLDDVIRGNGNLIRNLFHNAAMTRNSIKAFKALDRMRFDKAVNKYRTRPGIKSRITGKLKRIVKKLIGRK